MCWKMVSQNIFQFLIRSVFPLYEMGVRGKGRTILLTLRYVNGHYWDLDVESSCKYAHR